MHALEEEIEPLWSPSICDGAALNLSEQQRLLTARWTLKTAMVFEFTGTTAPFYSFQERDGLRNGELPNDMTIWLSEYHGRYMCNSFGARIRFDLLVHGGTVPVTAHCASITLGRLALQVLKVRRPEGVTEGFEFPVKEVWEDCTSVLWPCAESVAWPPPQGIDDTNFQEFVRRFDLAGNLRR